MVTQKHILLTIDVEDWFQVENFKPYISFSSWPERELRVERNVHLLLDLFDSVELKAREAESSPVERFEEGKLRSWEVGKVGTNAELEDQNKELNEPNQPNQLNNSSESVYNSQPTTNKSHAAAPAFNKQQTTYNKPTKKMRCTFFVLGWLAERIPNLVREIQDRGHEVASHGCNHQLPDKLSADELKQDLTDSKKLLEDITGAPVPGYRAPSFAINDDILKIIEDAGYLYDSSFNSFGLHGRYGQISLNGTGKKGIAHNLSDNFYELPISNLDVNNTTINYLLSTMNSGQNDEKRFVLPWGGGGYFRLLPFSVFNWGIKAITKRQNTYIFYCHPWEFDPDQPRVKSASFNYKFRHYTNLNKTQAKLRSLIESFNHCRFMTCSQYLRRPGSWRKE
jgi:polysaccharide deacetylase family protein (PEP-CTERM system associated)